MEFKRANTYKAVFFFLFSRKRYISIAINHGMAINLQKADHRKRYEEGKFPSKDWETVAKKKAIIGAAQVKRGLFCSFAQILLVALISLGIAYIKGSVNPMLPINCSLLASFLGVFLASWATLMELGGGFATYSGEALHELIHPAIFKLLFIPGVFLLLLGIVV